MDTLIKNTELSSDFILNSLQSPIIVINSAKKKIIYCNNATEIFLETSGKNIVGKKINSLFKNDSYFLSFFQPVLALKTLVLSSFLVIDPRVTQCSWARLRTKASFSHERF